MIANADGKIFGANAILREVFESLFNDSVFERVESYNRESPAAFEMIDGAFNSVGEDFEFVIDFDSDGLENSFGRVPAAFNVRR